MKKGFTLVELLIVIAILAMLSGILFPVFSTAREKARSANCQTNLMEIGNAVTMYAQDFDGRLLPCVSFAKNISNECEDTQMKNYSIGGYALNDCWAWSTILYPYVKKEKAYYCPSSVVDTGSTYELGYAINVNITSGNKFIFKGSNISGVRPKKINEINGTSVIYLISCGSPCGLFGSYINKYAKGETVYIPGTYADNDKAATDNIINNVDDAVSGRHNKYVNMLYLDNHVGIIPSSAVLTEINKGLTSVALNGRN